MKERKGCIFSISQDNEPVAGCTISKDVVHQDDCQVLYFPWLFRQTSALKRMTRSRFFMLLMGHWASMGRKENEKFRKARFILPGPVSLSA